MSHKRWRWVWIVGLLALLLAAQVAQSLAVPAHAPQGIVQVAIVRIGGDVDAAVRQAVAKAGGLEKVIEPGDTVVVKPNMVMDAPAGSGMVTDPAVARAVVRLAREAGAAQVIIAEGTAQYGQGDANRDRACTLSAFRNAGYDADGDMIDDATGAPLVDLNDSGGTDGRDPAKVRQVTVPMGLIRKEYWLPNVVLDADVLISVPVFKNHYNAGVTLGMKNLVGLLPNDIYHAPGNVYGKHSLDHSPVSLDQHIVDLSLARHQPDFVVVDGQRGMIDGPIGSQIIQPPMGLILAGRDVVALDTVGALVMGYDPRAIPYLQLGAQSGVGTTDVGHIQVVGVPVAQARRDFPAPYADSPARRADAQPPMATLNIPGGQPWSGAVTVEVQAGDDDALARVELYLDGKQAGQALAGPFQFSLDADQYLPGAHTLRAVVYDRSLNQAEAVQEVQFAAPTATALPPTATPVPPSATPIPPSATPVPLSATPVPPSATPMTPTITPSPSPTPTLPPPTLAAVVAPTTAAASMPGEPASVQPAEKAAKGRSPIPEWLLYVVGAMLGCLILAFAVLAVAIASGWRSSR
ncbi:MAG: DUF362 domain-containing protein [Anaerolineae bacterium]|nr:DUF362 domain-containing protein [Anaerolineae bacterium]